MIKSKRLSKFKNIEHAFFNRLGGKSTGIFKSLNCGPGSSDNKKDIQKNLEIVRNKFKADLVQLSNYYQYDTALKIKVEITPNSMIGGAIKNLLQGKLINQIFTLHIFSKTFKKSNIHSLFFHNISLLHN